SPRGGRPQAHVERVDEFRPHRHRRFNATWDDTLAQANFRPWHPPGRGSRSFNWRLPGWRLDLHAAMPLPPIIFEDDALIAFDKPSGLLVAPDRWDKQRENLMGMVHAHPRFGHGVANVHRLDADTSGLLLCAKTKPALDFL